MFELAKKEFRRLWVSTLSQLSSVNNTPVIVLGKEKSGTTAIAALLAEHTALSVTLDLPGVWGSIETRIHAGDIAFTDFVRRNKYGFSRDIIKEPGLTFLYPQVKEFFKLAKYLIIVRDPRDNTRSILNRLRMRGDMEDIDLNTFSTIPPGWQVVIDSRWLGLQGDTYIEMLAARWNLAADVYLEHRYEMIMIRYEDFMSDKVASIEKLAQQLELPQVNDISDKVDIQYQPRGDHDVSWEEFFGKENLMRIERICKSRMKKLGYS